MENKEKAQAIISNGVANLSLKYNAYLPILSAFQYVCSDMIPTAGVDRYCRLIFNPAFIVENEDCIKGILLHEVLHVFFSHFTRDLGKDAYLFNIAGDCAINQYVRDSGLPLPNGHVSLDKLAKELGLGIGSEWDNPRDSKKIYPYETAEYYYELIHKNMPEQKDNEKGNGGGAYCGGMFDNNFDRSDVANSREVQDQLDKMGVAHATAEQINESVQDTAVAITKLGGNGIGSDYGRLVDFAKEILEPKVDWRVLLRNTLRNSEKTIWSIHERQTFKRVSRRSRDVLIPKKCGKKISITLSFDTSGSISHEMVSQFLSEVNNAMKHSEIKECALWHTSVYWYGTPQELDRNISKVFESGGTDESCMGEASEHCKADMHIHFSDGYHNDNYGFKKKGENIEVVWENNNIKEIRSL